MIIRGIEIGKRIRERRKLLGMTQGELSAKIGKAPEYIGRLERGERMPSIQLVIDLSRCLGVSCDYLLTGGGKDEVDPGSLDPEIIVIINRMLEKTMEEYTAILCQIILSRLNLENEDEGEDGFEEMIKYGEGEMEKKSECSESEN